MKNDKITFIDLFAGAGGLSEGFVSSGFLPIAHVEMSSDACYTLRTRACYHYLKEKGTLDIYKKYLLGELCRQELYEEVPKDIVNTVINRTMSESAMPEIYSRIDSSMQDYGISHIDMVIGGPPCQAYSQVGRSRKCMDDDPRNELYKLYCQVLKRYEPEMFVFENVPGLFTAGQGKYLRNIQAALSDIGYDMDLEIKNAADYGVLQNRRRVIIIGWKHGTQHTYPKFLSLSHSYSVNDLLDDLPEIQAGSEFNHYKTEKFSKYLLETGIRSSEDILTWHIARGNIKRDREIYKKAISAWENGHRRLKYTELPEELCTHKNRDGFLDRFKVVAGDLPASHTMMAHISKDGHYFVHPDSSQARSISVREAARIQSFPDSFYFEGSRTTVFTQIGNAVPPLMAKSIAKAIKREFELEKPL